MLDRVDEIEALRIAQWPGLLAGRNVPPRGQVYSWHRIQEICSNVSSNVIDDLARTLLEPLRDVRPLLAKDGQLFAARVVACADSDEGRTFVRFLRDNAIPAAWDELVADAQTRIGFVKAFLLLSEEASP